MQKDCVLCWGFYAENGASSRLVQSTLDNAARVCSNSFMIGLNSRKYDFNMR